MCLGSGDGGILSVSVLGAGGGSVKFASALFHFSGGKVKSGGGVHYLGAGGASLSAVR